MTANAAVPPARRKRRAWHVIAELRKPRVALMLALGVSSGLPFALVGNTLGYWLADRKIDIATIGLVSAVGFAYTVKFLWGAIVDRIKLPLIGRLGRRRSWMIVAQVVVAAAFIAMATLDPVSQINPFVALAAAAAIGAAMQDTVIDAWRIESAADAEELGLLTSAYTLGYRIALIFTETLILSVAKRIGWPASYVICGAAMVIGLAAALLAKEPARADSVMEAKAQDARRHPFSAVSDAVFGPLIAFFRSHGLLMAALMLGMITLYHLSDYGRGPMIAPYYTALGIDKDTIAWVRLTLGTPATFVGIALGGVSAVRLGAMRTLVTGAIVQVIAVGNFAILGFYGGDFDLVALGAVHITAFQAIMAFDSLAMGYAGIALVSYMSTLTSLGYTATQYALLTSALAFTGKSLKATSGTIVKALQHGGDLLHALTTYYLVCAALGVPAILMCVVLAAVSRPRRVLEVHAVIERAPGPPRTAHPPSGNA